MGDRCYVAMQIGGTISSPRVALKICKAIWEQGWQNNEENARSVFADMADAFGRGIPLAIEFEEVNYADTDNLNTVLLEAGLVFTKFNGQGGDFSAGTTWFNFGFAGGTDDSWWAPSNEEGSLLTYDEVNKMLMDPKSAYEKLKAWEDRVDTEAPPIKFEGKALAIAAKIIGTKALTGEAA